MLPLSVNFHILKACNSRCRFCFATFRDVRDQLSVDDARRLIDALRVSGCEKLNLAGGEPTLHPLAGELLSHARAAGLVTSVVTNGFRLDRLLDDHAGDLDWVGLSVDSGDERVQAALGRGRGDHVANVTRLADRCLASEIKVKLNTVVTSMTWREDLGPLVLRIGPARWKVFQVLPMAGQNDGDVDGLLISGEQFEAFVNRHATLSESAGLLVAEDDAAMRGSYLMIDPAGRFFSNTTESYHYSDPILDVGVPARSPRKPGSPRNAPRTGAPTS